MGLTIEEQREKIRAEKKKISENILKKRIENRFFIKDYFVKGIYFLYQDDKIVYIGKANGNVFSRICIHFKDDSKIFDSFTFKKYNISDSQLLKIEKEFIKHYCPKYNTVNNPKKRKLKIIYGRNR